VRRSVAAMTARMTGPGHYAIIRDVARDRPARTPDHDSRPYCVGRPLDVRTAAMVLALKRIEAHYLLEGFSQ